MPLLGETLRVLYWFLFWLAAVGAVAHLILIAWELWRHF